MEVLHATVRPGDTPAYAIFPSRRARRRAVSRHDQLLLVLSSVPDPRKPRGRRYPLAAVIAVAMCAVLAGAKGFTAIGQWAAESTAATLTVLGRMTSCL
ncbi:hypothetical protein ALI22I_06440 [Saccharothrix sp. ALI-22-I]|uniref:transposase family protein n=1 Tax=Saccharothrix sp. ALI-22-I TaxID=1933778 RepID=UPI00097C965A|nr:transposase family protein [Saccharothrix sp. ALI-22-I]ONI91907.1 hypothetical protein ALI22I_06440 [Saccharothrix sp. ALI-22-I]